MKFKHTVGRRKELFLAKAVRLNSLEIPEKSSRHSCYATIILSERVLGNSRGIFYIKTGRHARAYRRKFRDDRRGSAWPGIRERSRGSVSDRAGKRVFRLPDENK